MAETLNSLCQKLLAREQVMQDAESASRYAEAFADTMAVVDEIRDHMAGVKKNVTDECILLMTRVLDSYNVDEIQAALGNLGCKADADRIVAVIQRGDDGRVRE